MVRRDSSPTTRMTRAEFYEHVSGAIHRAYGATAVAGERKGIVLVARELERMFMQYNTNFDPDRFWKDCGFPPGTEGK